MFILWKIRALLSLPIQCSQKTRLVSKCGCTDEPRFVGVQPMSTGQLLLPICLCVGKMVFPLRGLVDSGAQDSLLDKEHAVQTGCPLEPLPSPITATALDRRIITRVTHKMALIILMVSGNHSEKGPSPCPHTGDMTVALIWFLEQLSPP